MKIAPLLLILSLLFFFLAPRPALAADDTYETEISEKLRALDPDAVAMFAAGTTAYRAGEDKRAEEIYREVQRRVPSFGPVSRRLCVLASRDLRHDEAVKLCRRAVADEDIPLSRAALAVAIAHAKSAPAEARAEIDRAVAAAPEDVQVRSSQCQVAVALNDVHMLGRGVAVLEKKAPDEIGTWMFKTVHLAATDNMDGAFDALEEAKKRGLPDAEYREFRAKLEANAGILPRHFGSLTAKVLGGWLGGFGLLLVTGLVLSGATLRASRRLPQRRDGRAQAGDAMLRKLYRAVLWLASAFYYVSLPLVAVVVAAAGAGLVYLCFAIGRIPVKLLFIAAVVVLFTLWSILRAIFVRSRDTDPGLRLDLAQHPRLRHALHEVAGHIGTRPVDVVFLTPDTEVCVFERGGLLKQLRGKTERVLVIGAGVLEGMTVRQLKAILAHEYGHFHNEDTAGGGFALAVRRSLITMAISLARSGVATWYNPAWWFVRGFHAVFLRISQGASRLQEVLADRWAAFAYGSLAFEEGLRHVIVQSVRWGAHADAAVKDAIDARRPLPNLYRYPVGELDLAGKIDEELDRPASPYDSHPAPKDRIAWVQRLAAEGVPETESDRAPAWSLFEDQQKVEELMTAEIRDRVYTNHGIRIAG